MRSALSRFDQIQDVTDADRALAFENIRRAASYYDVDMTEQSWHDLASYCRGPGTPLRRTPRLRHLPYDHPRPARAAVRLAGAVERPPPGPPAPPPLPDHLASSPQTTQHPHPPAGGTAAGDGWRCATASDSPPITAATAALAAKIAGSRTPALVSGPTPNAASP